jgi:hypothetical protein
MSISIGFMVLSELIPPLPPRRAQDNPPPLPLHSPHTRYGCTRQASLDSPHAPLAAAGQEAHAASQLHHCATPTKAAVVTHAPPPPRWRPPPPHRHHRASTNNITVVTGHNSMTPISSTGVNVAQTALISVDHVAVLASLFVPPPPLPHSVFNFTAQQPKDNACGFSL